MAGGRSPYAKAMLRVELFDKQGGRCCYCERPIFIRGHTSEKSFPFKTKNGGVLPEYLATFEHIQRTVDGGTNRRGNLALACHHCNTRRGSMDWLSFKTMMMCETA